MLARWFRFIVPRFRQSIVMADGSGSTNGCTANTTESSTSVTSNADRSQLSTKLIWVDCEMTGLDPEINRICEIALVITDGNLTPIATFDPVIIKQTPEAMENMSRWCKKTFKKNGLLQRIADSDVDIQKAEEQVVEFLSKYTEPFTCALAGNSVYMDRMFIQKEMPKVAAHFHYRTVDVSSIKEMIRRWYPDKYNNIPSKKMTHRSIDDILESIEELQYYRKNFFIPGTDSSEAAAKSPSLS